MLMSVCDTVVTYRARKLVPGNALAACAGQASPAPGLCLLKSVFDLLSLSINLPKTLCRASLCKPWPVGQAILIGSRGNLTFHLSWYIAQCLS